MAGEATAKRPGWGAGLAVPRGTMGVMTAPILFGRDRELRVVADVLERAGERGGGLLVRGPAGIGKTSVLEAARARAAGLGFRVLAATGVQSEGGFAFGGLHQLLRPVLAKADILPVPQRDALRAAFGMTEGVVPDLFLIALGSLEVLSEAAAGAPLLLIADDAQWLDRPTAAVLAFLARRLDVEPIILLAGLRDGYDSDLTEAGMPELAVAGLDEAAAAALLEATDPGLDAAARARVLADAAGNPLALVELPAALRSAHWGDGAILPAVLPLTARLERTFATRAAGLPAPARRVLLAAAVDDEADLAEVLAVAGRLAGPPLPADALDPAVAAGLVEADQASIRFRHPLVRSAIYQQASPPQQRAAHAALAAVLASQPDRRAWHRAAATAGADEDVAAELEAAASRAHRRGAVQVALASQQRAAMLSPDPGRRAGRLLRAAEMGFELGRHDVVDRLLAEAERYRPGPLQRARIAWIRELFHDGTPGDAQRVRHLVQVADQTRLDGDTDLALNLLLGAAVRSWWADPGEPARELVVAAAERAGAAECDPRLLAIVAAASPISRGGDILARLARVAAADVADPRRAWLLGMAAMAAGDFERGVRFLSGAADGLRAQGRLALLAQALSLQANGAIHLGNWAMAVTAADEGTRLAEETGQPLWLAEMKISQAQVAALRGQHDTVGALTGEAERTALPGRLSHLMAMIQLARGMSALSAGRHADAYDYLRRMFDPADAAFQRRQFFGAIPYFAEAAVHSGHTGEARAVLAGVEPIAALTPAPKLHVGLAYARAALATGDDAEPLFAAAFDATAGRWPHDRARLDLLYGSWLRRHRRVTESRVPLRAARDWFDTQGLSWWADQARQELRAAGETSHRRAPNAWDRLSPQELQIARMAADGLSNRDIGERLYLSHRTVGYHLYRIFPKLGITSRSQLNAALEGGAAPGGGGAVI
jgi:DNA-binding CsgD family transcriptional regulator